MTNSIESKKEIKLRVVKSKCLAGALVWLGFDYTRDAEDNYIFERTNDFDITWKYIHVLRSDSKERIAWSNARNKK